MKRVVTNVIVVQRNLLHCITGTVMILFGHYCILGKDYSYKLPSEFPHTAFNGMRAIIIL